MNVKIVSKSGQVPHYQTKGSSGMDVRAYLPDGDLVLEPGDRYPVPTGLFFAVPEGCEAQVRARSGLALKYGIGLPNGVGTIDSDYRGELKVLLINWGKEPFVIRDGDRIAQLVFARYESVEWELTETLDETDRGTGGFGSTGK